MQNDIFAQSNLSIDYDNLDEETVKNIIKLGY